MTTIPINDQWRIDLDTHSWQVSRRKKHAKRPGGYCWEGVAWFPELQQCLKWLTERELREADLTGAVQIENALARLLTGLAAAIEAAGIENRASRERRRSA